MGAAPTGRAVRTFAIIAALAAVSAVLAQAADARRGPLYVSKDGSHRSACTKARPCRSFGRAYDLARPGQVVLVRGGHYRAQRIRFDRKGSGRDVIFRPATRKRVFVAGLLDIQWAQHLEVRGLRVNAWRTVGARDVTLRSLVAKWFSIQGGDGVRVVGGRAGPALNRSNRITATTRDSPHPPTSVRIDGLTVQGNRRTSVGPAVGCLDVRAVDGLVVRNSRIFDCGDFGIRFPASDPAGPARNVVVENDIVSCCLESADAISLDGDPSTRWTDILIRNNSVVGSLSAGSSGYLAEIGVYANIASEFVGCRLPGLVADYNVWGAGSACGAQDVVSANGFVNPRERNFELAPGAAAIDIAAVGTSSRMDIDGQARPVGPTSDAGAKESRNSALVAAFPLNEVAGSAASDASGEANAGVVTGATWTSNGRFGGALSFDGDNDWMTVLDNPSLDLTNAMTLEAWVKPAVSSSEWRTVLMKERPGGLAYGLYGETSTGQPSGNVDVGTELDARAPAPLPVNAWTHLAATYDGSSLRLFLNGRQVSSRSASGSLMPSASPLRLGGNSVWDEWFAGSIDEVRVYDRVLSASEVKKDMGSAIRVASDTTPPSAPLGLLATGQSASSVSVSWTASVDDSGLAGYGLYRNGVLNGSTAVTTYTYTGLSCGTTYTFAVDAYDSAGNRSAQTSISVATDSCPPPDTTAPSAPGSFTSTGATQSSISVSWNASSDNVAATGYGLYRDGTSAGSTGVSPRTYTYTGLTCGTSYTLEVDATDAAGNRSAKTSLTASTSACPSGETANLWVDMNGGSCARQSSPGSWVDAQACSWNQAYQAAQAGDRVVVRGGSYGNVGIGPNKASLSAPGVTFAPASGATVTVNDFENGVIFGADGGNNITFLGPVRARSFRADQTSNIVVDGWTIDCGGCDGEQIFHLEESTNVTVRNSDISDNKNNSLMWINGTNLTFEGNEIHDAGLPAGSPSHTECMYAWDVTNLTLKRNHFYHCSVMDVFITGSDVSTGGHVENNVFEKPWDHTGSISNSAYSFHFRNGGSPSPDPNDWDFRYNTFVGPLSVTTTENQARSGGMRVIGNVFLSGAPCGQPNTTYSYNAFVSGGCGTNSITNSLATFLAGFTSTADPGTYSLKSTSVLRDKGNPANYPSDDFAGSSRFTGPAPDLGAYEG